MDTWSQRITADAMRAFRRLADDNLRDANVILNGLQVDPRPAGATEQGGVYSVSLGTATVEYEILDDQQATRIVKIEVL